MLMVVFSKINQFECKHLIRFWIIDQNEIPLVPLVPPAECAIAIEIISIYLCVCVCGRMCVCMCVCVWLCVAMHCDVHTFRSQLPKCSQVPSPLRGPPLRVHREHEKKGGRSTTSKCRLQRPTFQPPITKTFGLPNADFQMPTPNPDSSNAEDQMSAMAVARTSHMPTPRLLTCRLLDIALPSIFCPSSSQTSCRPSLSRTCLSCPSSSSSLFCLSCHPPRHCHRPSSMAYPPPRPASQSRWQFA